MLKFLFINWIVKHAAAFFVTHATEKNNLPKNLVRTCISRAGWMMIESGQSYQSIKTISIARSITQVLEGNYREMSISARNAAQYELEWPVVIEKWRTTIEGISINYESTHGA